MSTRSFWRDQRVLVTGSEGFIGRNLVAALRDAGTQTTLGLDAVDAHGAIAAHSHATIDLRHSEDVIRFVDEAKPTVVFHLAARTDLEGTSLEQYASTTVGTENLVSAIARSKSSARLVVTSSRLVCRTGHIPSRDDDYCPDTTYGMSKVRQEQIVRSVADSDIAWVIARPTSIWGPHFSVPYRGFFAAVARGLYAHPRGLRVEKSMGYIGNTVQQLLALAEHADTTAYGRTFHLCDYEPLEVWDWANIIAEEFGSSVREVPLSMLKLAAAAGDGLKRFGHKNPRLTTFRLNNLLTRMVYETDELRELCGPSPCNLRDGVTSTVEWMRAANRDSR